MPPAVGSGQGRTTRHHRSALGRDGGVKLRVTTRGSRGRSDNRRERAARASAKGNSWSSPPPLLRGFPPVWLSSLFSRMTWRQPEAHRKSTEPPELKRSASGRPAGTGPPRACSQGPQGCGACPATEAACNTQERPLPSAAATVTPGVLPTSLLREPCWGQDRRPTPCKSRGCRSGESSPQLVHEVGQLSSRTRPRESAALLTAECHHGHLRGTPPGKCAPMTPAPSPPFSAMWNPFSRMAVRAGVMPPI